MPIESIAEPGAEAQTDGITLTPPAEDVASEVDADDGAGQALPVHLEPDAEEEANAALYEEGFLRSLEQADQALRHLRAVCPDGTYACVVDYAKRKVGGWYADLPSLAQDVVCGQWGDARAVYIPACEHQPAIDPWHRDEDTATALRAYWCDVDCRSDAHPTETATKEAVLAALRALSVSPTIIVDTGHGVQAWWVLTEPLTLSDAAARAEAKALLAQWAAALQAAGVPADDGAGKDLARLLRLASTWNIKADPSDKTRDLPPVWAELLTVEGPRHALADLRAFAEAAPAAPPVEKAASGTEGNEPPGWSNWRKFGDTPEDVLALPEAPVTKGGQSEVRGSCVLALVRGGRPDDEVRTLLRDSPWALKGHDAGLADREVQGAHKFLDAQNAQKQAAASGVHAVRLCLADVAPLAVAWTWPGRIPSRMVSILEGDTEQGKSQITLDIAARLTTGREMPDGTAGLEGPRNVVLLACEDDPATVLRPRADAAGVDVHRLTLLRGVREPGKDGIRPVTLQDMVALREAVGDLRPALVVIDPLQAYLGTANMAKAEHMRPLFEKIAAMAEEFSCAVVVLRHLRKEGSDRAQQRGAGSYDIGAAARSQLLAGCPPNDKKRHALAHLGCNIAPQADPLEYELIGVKFTDANGRPGETSHVEWRGKSDLSAADLLAPEATPNRADHALKQAKKLLQDFLADGPRLAKEGYTVAAKAEVSESTLKRARTALGVVVYRLENPGPWWWKLP